jgi:hypothetical protein
MVQVEGLPDILYSGQKEAIYDHPNFEIGYLDKDREFQIPHFQCLKKVSNGLKRSELIWISHLRSTSLIKSIVFILLTSSLVITQFFGHVVVERPNNDKTIALNLSLFFKYYINLH